MRTSFIFPSIFFVLSLFLVSCQSTVDVVSGYSDKEAISNILSRKSVRSYEDRAVEQDKVDLILRAGMSAPSGMDRRPWEIVVINDRSSMDSLAFVLPYAKMLSDAPMAIVVCGDVDRSHYWYIDCSAVTQNILLAVEALDLGAVWTGVYTSEEREKAVSEVLGLPEHIIPLAVIPVGYPKGTQEAKDKYDSKKVHYNKW